jgi:hypothetical protein
MPINLMRGNMQTVSVAQFISNHISASRKSRLDIAKEIGYDSEKVIQGFEKGTHKVPINVVKPLAGALGADPVQFFETVLAEYMPETWAVFKDVMGELMLSDHERQIVLAYRELARGRDIDVLLCPTRGTAEVTVSRNE